ncbi:hypothetical protein BDV96DRAFT_572796 [Lophiotrema nucula]|uniref:Uncharacterized protein n=1 Tax=Lophiotrema nucula TaxID=690887 RepID=A0A6A5ZDC9_9PLEO|nr:hypothetical protein BDV96DRAFT_572796 [Lophiotrema nucula]
MADDPLLSSRDPVDKISAAKRQDVPVDNCHPNDYRCTDSGDAILVCSSLGKWELSAPCSGGAGHCRPGFIPNTFYCSSAAELRGVDARESQPSDLVVIPQPPQSNGECEPGCYTCDASWRYIAACSTAGHWIVETDCGREGACKLGAIRCTSFCVGELKSGAGSRDLPTIESREPPQASAESETRSVEPREDQIGEVCTPGTYTCGVRAIYVCVGGRWQFAASCGEHGTCHNGTAGAAPYCTNDATGALRPVELPSARSKREEGTVLVVRDGAALLANLPEPCKPGYFQGAKFEVPRESRIYACATDAHWVHIANCGPWDVNGQQCLAGGDGAARCNCGQIQFTGAI